MNKPVLISGLVIAIVGLVGTIALYAGEGFRHKTEAAIVVLAVGLVVAGFGLRKPTVA